MAKIEIGIDPAFLGFSALVEIDLTLSIKQKMKEGGMKTPLSLRANALIDTGASWCAASPDLIDQLYLSTKSNKKNQ